MAQIKKVLLIGASGNLGSAILNSLQKANIFQITILSRSDSKATFPSTLNVIKTDYTPPNLISAFKGQDAIINASGLGGLYLQKTMIDACLTSGVYRYITNDFGNAIDFHGLPELAATQTPKRKALAHAQHQASTNPQFTWTALATGHFLDLAIKKFPAAFGFNVPERKVRIVDGGDEPFSATTMSDIGDAVIGILKQPEETANKFLLVRTLETTQNDLLQAFELQMGTKWTVEHASSKELYERGKQKMAEGLPGAILDMLPAQLYERGAGRYGFPEDRYDNKLLEVREKSVDEVVRDVLDSV